MSDPLHEAHEALKGWVRDLMNHPGAHHSMPSPPVDLTPTEEPHEEA